MKNTKFIKTNILSVALILLLSLNTFSDDFTEKYGPAAYSEQRISETVSSDVLANLVNDDAFITRQGSGIISSADVNAIRQIVLTDASSNVSAPTAASIYNGTQVSSPTPLIVEQTAYPTPTGDVISSIVNYDINLNNFTVKNITGTKVQDTQAPTYALINATTREIYATKDQNTKYNPSGLTNLMTAYIATRYLNMNSVLTVNSSAVRNLDKDASIAQLSAGDTITLKDALISMFVKGCVDSSNVVAENVAGSISEFVKLMNENAASLGLTNTKFVDPSGIGENETTALDMAIIMAKVCENTELAELLKIYQYTLPAVSKRGKLIIYSRNTQLNKDNATHNADVVASRLAHSSKTKFCIASLMQQNNQNYIAVVLKADGQQFVATKKLFDFAKTVDGITTK